MKLAVIPARGGSKRIPRKNIRPFNGRPIIAWSIAAARLTDLFDHVIVSTDDDEIAETAAREGAEVPFRRPAALSDDRTGTNAVVRHALSFFAEKGEPAELACCVYATAPFVSAAAILDGYERLSRRGHGFAFSVTTYAYPIQRAFRISPGGTISMFQPEHLMTRSQDLEEAWHDAGQFYWGYADAFLAELPVFSEHSIPIPVPRHRVQDIDTLEDWLRAELMFAALVAESEARS
jgi:N-acylneuraminate cytidylyltransferase